jgi:hypothetical protein
MEQNKIEKLIEVFRKRLQEQVPTNALSFGKIAGTSEAGDDPPIKKRKKYISGGKGSRKLWLDYLKNK